MGIKETSSQNYIFQQKVKHSQSLTNERQGRMALVIGSDRRENIGAKIGSALRASGFFLHVGEWSKEIDGDICDVEHRTKLFRDGDWDTVIFCNGYTRLDWIEKQECSEIRQVLDDTLLASMLGAKNFVQFTLDKPWHKRIVFIGSMAYRNVLNGSAPYCAAKAGLAHFSRCLAWELAPKGYSVFCVHPSNTEGTPMTEETIRGLQRYRGLSREEAEQYWGACLPKLNWLQPENIAEVVKFLVSGAGDYLSGSNLDLAGGQR